MVEPITATLVVLAAAGVAAGGTKTGRAAAGNASRAGYKATGWRTPGKAIPHHAGRVGALAGRLTGKAARGTRRLAARAARAAGRGTARAAGTGTARMATRWADRTARGGATPRPPITWPTWSKPHGTRATPDVRPTRGPDAIGRQTEPDAYRVSALPDGHPLTDRFALTVERHDGGSWSVRRGLEVLNRQGAWEIEPWPSDQEEAFLKRTRYSRDDALAAATREAPRVEFNGLTASDVLARDANTAAATTDGPQTGPTTGPPNTSDAGDPPTAPPSTTAATPARTTPRARDRAERSTQVRNRYTINLEMPSSDAEFLESCVHLGDILKAIAEEIGEWANSLSGLNLPQSVIQPLDSISDGLVEAAGGASQAAKSFEDEFEDAREVASRGMTITGQDAA